MAKYRKKPVVIDAHQFYHFRENWTHAPLWLKDAHSLEPDTVGAFHVPLGSEKGYIVTLEGRMTVSPGDWIIKGVAGEIYPCKDSIFRKTYNLVEEP